MDNKDTAPSGRMMPYSSALGAVVKGLRADPVLLYGIGAGIIIVGVLVFTASAKIVLLVAALFIVVLFARAHQDAKIIQKGTDVRIFGSSVEDSEVGNMAQGGGVTTARARVYLSRLKRAGVGNVGRSEQQKLEE
jgi:hypothetical protein